MSKRKGRGSRQGKKQPARHAPRSPRPSGVGKAPTTWVPAASPALKPFFRVLDDVARVAERALAATRPIEDHLQRFDVGIFVRGLNQLKAIRILLEQGHWETGCAPARQLFELLINMEYLNSTSDRDAAALDYVRFGLLQQTQRQLRELAYNRGTGRPVEEERQAWLEALLGGPMFADYKTEKNGKITWARSWSGKNARQLAELSASHMRVHQYEQLFTIWSEEAHAAPGALLETVMPRRADTDWAQEAITDNDRESAQLAATAAALLLELSYALPQAPQFAPEAMLAWTTTLKEHALAMGGRPPPAA